jgi:lysozyme family protein
MNKFFEEAFKVVLGYEGGYSNDAADSGGETRYGITIAEARRHGYQGDMKDFPLDMAKQIYESDYWNTQRLDDVAVISYPIALEMFETGVNMGCSISKKFLQEGLNFMNNNQKRYPDLVVDGTIGPKTIGTLSLLGKNDLNILYKLLNIMQGARYLDICRNNKTQEVFIRGWLTRVTVMVP